ncbi:MAG: hypothetical protein QXH03_08295 [Candidatus Bathyarchaeia archaeon]
MEWSLPVLIKELMQKVTSADMAYEWLRRQGYEFTRAEVRRVWKEVGEKEYWSTVLETYGIENVPPHWWTMPGKKGQKQEYLYIFEAIVIDPQTLKIETTYVSAYSKRLRSYADLWREMGEDLAASLARRGYVLLSWAPGGILKKPS